MSVPLEAFHWRTGEAQLSRYESSPGKWRYFCSNCGSQLIAQRDNVDYVLIRVGAIDTEFTERPLGHIWRSDAAPWYDPRDKLPMLPEGAP